MTNAELAILSLIAEQPRHGYEIEQVIEERGMREWTEVGFSSIYYVLKKLEGAGLVYGRLQQQAGRGPARKVYAVTDDGRAAWRKGTIEALSIPQHGNMPFQLGLANLPGLDSDERVTAVSQYRDRLAAQRDHVRARYAEEGQAAPLHVQAMFDLSLTLIEAELGWMEQFIAGLSDDQVPGS
jgi:DNA-binding PadR family transcriptional regulator